MLSSVATDGAQPASSRWHNALPRWILGHPAYAGVRGDGSWKTKPLGPGPRAVLQSIADAGERDAAGNIAGCFGGQGLVEAAACGRSTWWRHLKRLVELGFVVQVARGGTVRNRNLGNLYAIPAAPGRLDDLRCRARTMVMRPGAGDGVRRPQALHVGDQAPLWAPEPAAKAQGATGRLGVPPDPGASQGRAADAKRAARGAGRAPAGIGTPSQNGTTPRPNLGLPPSQNGTPPSLPSSWFSGRKPSGAFAENRRGLGHVHREDLEDLERLACLWRRAAFLGLADESEAGWLQFAALAEHAQRVGDVPEALFAALLRHQRFLFVTQEDEELARRRLQAARDGWLKETNTHDREPTEDLADVEDL